MRHGTGSFFRFDKFLIQQKLNQVNIDYSCLVKSIILLLISQSFDLSCGIER